MNRAHEIAYWHDGNGWHAELGGAEPIRVSADTAQTALVALVRASAARRDEALKAAGQPRTDDTVAPRLAHADAAALLTHLVAPPAVGAFVVPDGPPSPMRSSGSSPPSRTRCTGSRRPSRAEGRRRAPFTADAAPPVPIGHRGTR